MKQPICECALLSGNNYNFSRNDTKLPRTKIVTKERKESLPHILKRIAKDRLVIVSLVLIVVGMILIGYSYSYTDVLVTPNISTYQKTASNASTESVIILQPYNVSGNITFEMPQQYSVHYELYQYFHINNKGTLLTQYVPVEQGNATNNTVISISPTYHPQGQSYALNFTSNGNVSFPVKISAVFNVVIVEHTSRYVGGTGLALSISGAVVLAYAITRVFGATGPEYRRI